MDVLVPQALQQAPHDPETLCDYAAVLSNTEERTRHAAADKIDAAEACYDKCLAAEPQHVRALYNLAVMRVSRGDKAKAEELLQRALNADPVNPHVNAEYARCLAPRVAPYSSAAHYGLQACVCVCVCVCVRACVRACVRVCVCVGWIREARLAD